jgi:ferredoxin/quinol-cytochrome oxidoreductase complex cytochrome b subunit/coenzyme F420-reducing hydrogenase delta subunit
MSWLKQGMRAFFERLEDLSEGVFGPQSNPLRQLGAIGWLLFGIVVVSGIYLYIFFDTGVTQAYESIESLTHAQWWAGGIMRSFHRYASDALVVLACLHLAREFAFDRLHGPRWFAWVTGLVVLVLIYVCGITGYWMVWDQLAQYVALTTTEWLDRLPLFAEPIARNFLGAEYLSGRFFTLMVYLHIFAPLFMLLIMWLHIMRYTDARLIVRRGLAWTLGVALVVLSLAFPAVSQPPADLGQIAESVGLDWFYLPLYPLFNRWSGTVTWLGVLGIGVALLLLPWLPPRRLGRVAVVNLENCNGCGRCVADCPFSAITLEPRSDGTAFDQEAVVHAGNCVSCGICVGACPTASPFRRATALVPGIELPDAPMAALRDEVTARSAGLQGTQRVVVFACRDGAPIAESASTAVIQVPCVGMVPPPFLDFVLARGLAAGVLLAGCRDQECYHRLGARWTSERIAMERDPQLRARVSRDRVGLSWAARTQRSARRADLSAFQAQLAAGAQAAGAAPRAWQRVRPRLMIVWRALGQAAVFAALTVLVGYFSVAPAHPLLAPNHALISLSFSYAGHLKQPCKPLSAQEAARLQPNMRRPRDCPRARWPVEVALLKNGELLYAGKHEPAGLWSDGPSTVYKRFAVPAGPVELTVRLRDTGRSQGFDFERSERLDLKPGQNLVIDFHGDEGGFSIR